MEFKKQQIMKQPELGQKIVALRKQKGLTQEELVEQCNINVRTIQRIEAGNVSPRSYTVKAILDVLGFDYESIFEDHYVPGKFDAFLGINKEKISKQLNTAMIFGIIFFVSGFLEVGADLISFEKDSLSYISIYAAIKLLSVISLFFFFRGFVITGGMYKNYLLHISSVLIIIFTLFFSALDITSLFIWEEFLGVFGFAKLIAYGALSVLFGIGIKRLVDFGGLARWTGIVEITTGICLLAIILSPIAIVTQFIAEIFEIILIYRVASKIKKTV